MPDPTAIKSIGILRFCCYLLLIGWLIVKLDLPLLFCHQGKMWGFFTCAKGAKYKLWDLRKPSTSILHFIQPKELFSLWNDRRNRRILAAHHRKRIIENFTSITKECEAVKKLAWRHSYQLKKWGKAGSAVENLIRPGFECFQGF